MKREGDVRISQCMIVKNEEKNIERALSWGKGIVSEQIVVDTGSTDRTVEIAERMGAKIYHFEWVDDFAAAKNYAISKARYEWIALLDADEYFSQEDAEKLLYYIRQLHDKRYDIIWTKWVNLDHMGKVMTIGTQERVFRNVPGLRYQRRIHEHLTSLNGEKFFPVDATNELSIYHTGYEKSENQAKIGRNLKLIEVELAEHPDDWEMISYLGDIYHAAGDLEKAEVLFRKAVSMMPEYERNIINVRIEMTFVKLLEILYAKHDTDETTFMDMYHKAVSYLPGDGDPDYCAGRYFIRHNKYDAAERHLRKALELLENHGCMCKSSVLSGQFEQACEWLALCCCNNGNMADCVRYCIVSLKSDRYRMDTLFLMLVAFFKDETSRQDKASQAGEVLDFLGKNFYDFEVLKDRCFVLKAAVKAGYTNLTQELRSWFTAAELEAIEHSWGDN